jgi:hypothetical protein
MPGNTDQDQQELLHLNRDTPQPADRDTREINRAHTRRSNRDTPLFRLVNKPPRPTHYEDAAPPPQALYQHQEHNPRHQEHSATWTNAIRHARSHARVRCRFEARRLRPPAISAAPLLGSGIGTVVRRRETAAPEAPSRATRRRVDARPTPAAAGRLCAGGATTPIRCITASVEHIPVLDELAVARTPTMSMTSTAMAFRPAAGP